MKFIRMVVISLAVLVASFAAAQSSGQPFRLVFSNTNLSTVLRAIGLHTNANIVYVGREDPMVTLNVTATNADEALRFASTAAGVMYRRVGQTYVVARPEDLRQAIEPFGVRERLALEKLSPGQAITTLRQALPYVTVQQAGTQLLVIGTAEDVAEARRIVRETEATMDTARVATEVVPVRVMPVARVAEVLTDLFPDVRFRTVAQGDVGGSILITGTPTRVAEARQMLTVIDTRNPAPGTEEVFRTYYVRYSSAPILLSFLRNAMPDLEAFAGPENYAPPAPGFRPLTGARTTGSGGAGGTGGISTGNPGGGVEAQPGRGETRREAGERSKTIVLRGASDRVEMAQRLLAEQDVKPQQVMVEVKVVDYSPSSDSAIGFNWDWTRFGFYEVPGGTPVDTDAPNAEPLQFNTRPAGFGIFSRVPWTFQSVLQALVTRREAKLLATPSVQVIDNEDANIFIGDTIRARVAQAGALGAQNIEIVEFPIGIILLIRPRVNADGDITMRVHPVVSTVTALDSQNVPQTSTREAETTVVVRNGETIVLGGLIRDEESRVVREVPFLSQLPLIGQLFRSTTKTGRKSEILVFITPRLIDNATGAAIAPGTTGATGGAGTERRP